MRDVKKMTYDEMANEVIQNRRLLRAATNEKARQLINRNHDLMSEMDSRWEKAGR